MRRRTVRRPPENSSIDERVGRVLTIEVERIVPGGLGLAHGDGLTLFVALSAPGDVVEVEIESVRGRTGFARIRRIIKPSPARVAPPCSYFGDPARCGGCDFQQLDYNAQLAAKLDIIRDAMRRTGRIEELPPLSITSAPREWEYRSRVEWQHDHTGKKLGYYARGSHRVVDVERCPVAAPELNDTLANLRGQINAGRLNADVTEFRAMAGDGAQVALAPPTINHSTHELTRTIRGEVYRYDAACFFQINHDLLPELIGEALRPLESNDADERHGFALDLYCGVGLFTVPLARKFSRVVGVESHPVSSRYAGENLDAADLANAEVETASVKDWLARAASRLPPIDFVLLDPPRAGAEPETTASLARLRPRRIAYVSCDPVTLARDLALLLPRGYILESLCAFDLFPQTHHVETVAHLTRGGAAG